MTLSIHESLISISVVEMDRILKDPNLLATCRRLSYGGSSGMNCALDHYQGLILSRSVDAKGIFAQYHKEYVGWALLTRETDNYSYRPEPGTVCFQIFVDGQYRRNGIGSKLLRQAKSLIPAETLLVYGSTGHYFFDRHMREGVCTSIYGRMIT